MTTAGSLIPVEQLGNSSFFFFFSVYLWWCAWIHFRLYLDFSKLLNSYFKWSLHLGMLFKCRQNSRWFQLSEGSTRDCFSLTIISVGWSLSFSSWFSSLHKYLLRDWLFSLALWRQFPSRKLRWPVPSAKLLFTTQRDFSSLLPESAWTEEGGCLFHNHQPQEMSSSIRKKFPS